MAKKVAPFENLVALWRFELLVTLSIYHLKKLPKKYVKKNKKNERYVNSDVYIGFIRLFLQFSKTEQYLAKNVIKKWNMMQCQFHSFH